MKNPLYTQNARITRGRAEHRRGHVTPIALLHAAFTSNLTRMVYCAATSVRIPGVALRAKSIITVAVLALWWTAMGLQPAQAQDYQVLVYFTGQPVGNPSNIIPAKNGVYGFADGGIHNCPYGDGGFCGIVFQLDESGQQTVLYSFKGVTDGSVPIGTLTQDGSGNLYGATLEGGDGECTQGGTVIGCGTVFMLTPPAVKGEAWTHTILYSFHGSDGRFPWAGVVLGAAGGGLYGTTEWGGAFGWGTLFRINAGTETVLYSFRNQEDGGGPRGGLLLDGAGVLYGTAGTGGVQQGCTDINGCGTVFSFNLKTGTGAVLHRFTPTGGDGQTPNSTLVRDALGNLYGTTAYGGSADYGTVFKLSPGGNETVLHAFQGWDGGYPETGLARDSAGNLYGSNSNFGEYGYGTLFEITAEGKFKVLNQNYQFGGIYPSSTLLDAQGQLYGTMGTGGDYQFLCASGVTCGTLFRLTP
jgi:uncharacterized repeat protein (TIGR03803 family)